MTVSGRPLSWEYLSGVKRTQEGGSRALQTQNGEEFVGKIEKITESSNKKKSANISGLRPPHYTGL